MGTSAQQLAVPCDYVDLMFAFANCVLPGGIMYLPRQTATCIQNFVSALGYAPQLVFSNIQALALRVMIADSACNNNHGYSICYNCLDLLWAKFVLRVEKLYGVVVLFKTHNLVLLGVGGL